MSACFLNFVLIEFRQVWNTDEIVQQPSDRSRGEKQANQPVFTLTAQVLNSQESPADTALFSIFLANNVDAKDGF